MPGFPSVTCRFGGFIFWQQAVLEDGGRRLDARREIIQSNHRGANLIRLHKTFESLFVEWPDHKIDAICQGLPILV